MDQQKITNDLVFKFTYRSDGNIELCRQQTGMPDDIVVMSDPVLVASFAIDFQDFLMKQAGFGGDIDG